MKINYNTKVDFFKFVRKPHEKTREDVRDEIQTLLISLRQSGNTDLDIALYDIIRRVSNITL